MGIYKRVRHLAVAAVCATGLVAGMGAAVAPGSALAAKVKCAKITGSGSSLQKAQQTEWSKIVNESTFVLKPGAEECEPGDPGVKYFATSSGHGLTEFGMEGGGLKPAEAGNGESKLDGFFGTDDPPTLTQLEKAKEATGGASGTKAWVIPVVAAPIAVIVHLPENCKLKASPSAAISNEHLSEEFAGGKLSWTTLLGTAVEGTACGTATPVVEVRSDSSGTSYAFKQYLCQIAATVWLENLSGVESECQQGKGAVTDTKKWPKETAVSGTHLETEGGSPVNNEKGSGEVKAVLKTGFENGGVAEKASGSIGYANLADAVEGGFEASSARKQIFWVKAGEHTEEPISGGKGNCPTSYTIPSESEAKNGEWALAHLANKKQATGAYPLCTFTYDVGWENYTVAKLIEQYGEGKTEPEAKEQAKAVGNTAKAYLEYEVSTAASPEGGQKKIANDYHPLPTATGGTSSVLAIAQEDAKKIG
jgi:ABC-type phosphate transport system substrate-binding protein